ncbi:g5321 [Coccomyxa viridis]|uniref:G5321 protein n=1 Tax=Coccomyxa viridis TaxID=1274662 RepID=A0ABP1FXP5_9CHLO
MGNHKHKTSNVPDDIFTDHVLVNSEASPLNSRSPQRRSGNLRLLSEPKVSEEGLAPSISGHSAAPSKTSSEAAFTLRGRPVRAWLTSLGINLVPCSAPWWAPWANLYHPPDCIPFEEILSACARERSSTLPCAAHQQHLIIYTFKRSRRKQCVWKPCRLVLKCKSAELVQEWAMRINMVIRTETQRPTNLLVIINPFGGARKARNIWRKKAEPVFLLAGIKSTVVETQRADHAKEIVTGLSLSELQSFDGFIAVGGDGLFQEILNGLLAIRGNGGQAGQVAAHLRLGHIPAGSTDAVAYSLNGCRCQATAALHIALGDRTPLDVMRVDMSSGAHRYAVCVASYGYMGDLMRTSERLRFLGPARYGLAGAWTLLRGAAYDAEVSYLPAPGTASTAASKECRAACSVCSPTVPSRDVGQEAAFMSSSRKSLTEDGWVQRQGRYKSIMAVVTSCRSDMSSKGLSPHGHLCDGRLHLVLVHASSRLQYLRFLASIPREGVQAGKFPFVEMIDCAAVHLTPVGAQSCWNVDGELLPDTEVTMKVHRGLADVFARGIE